MQTTAPTFSGPRLKQRRERRKLSQQALCALIRPDLSITTLRRWESGVSAPSYNDIAAVAQALGVEMAYFSDPAS